MKLKYDKTWSDQAREAHDLKTSPIMRFLKHQDYYKFNVGDILIKQRKWSYNSEWETECITGVQAPKKYMYVFENELGIGYIKQLRVDGTGFTNALICTANFDPDSTRFTLDPDYVDHMLVGEEDFQYNTEYLNKKAFREEAIAKNTKLLLNTHSTKKRIQWFAGLNVGDEFWCGYTFDELATSRYKVISSVTNGMPRTIEVVIVEHERLDVGQNVRFDEDEFIRMRVASQRPFPMKDPLCGNARPK